MQLQSMRSCIASDFVVLVLVLVLSEAVLVAASLGPAGMKPTEAKKRSMAAV